MPMFLILALAACYDATGRDEPTPETSPAPAAFPTPAPTVFQPAAEVFDLRANPFHRSTVAVTPGNRVDVSIEVRQERDPQLACGSPTVNDPFGNLLVALVPTQSEQSETESTYQYRYAFFAAAEGEYAASFENRECVSAGLAATSTVQWAVWE